MGEKHSIYYLMRGHNRPTSNGVVFSNNGKNFGIQWVDKWGCEYNLNTLDRRDMRLLARRINQALEDTK